DYCRLPAQRRRAGAPHPGTGLHQSGENNSCGETWPPRHFGVSTVLTCAANWKTNRNTLASGLARVFEKVAKRGSRMSSSPLCRPGNDLLSRVLRRSTIGAGAFHGRVRNGIGCSHPAIITRSTKG